MSDQRAAMVRGMAEKLSPRLRRIRRQLHRRPELSFQERRTAALVADRLRDLGLTVRERICRTGVVALLKGGMKGKTVGLRADMDALPIQEQTAQTYRSRIPGCMHACGHDAHVACLLGAAEILSQVRHDLPGTVKFIFQPGEEDLPSGALEMVRAGVLKRPPVEALVALHVDPGIPSGHVGIRTGPFLAEARDFDIVILGRSGHGAHPQQGIDAIVTAAHFIAQLQSVVSRRVDPLQPAVVSIGEIRGGRADNIIADRVELKGTLRYLNDELGDELASLVESMLRGVTAAAGARGRIRWSQGCVALTNDRKISQAIHQAVSQLYGPQAVQADIPQSMGGDDFAYFLRHVPGALFTLGTNDGTKRNSYPLHHPKFDIDERALAMGAATYVQTAWNLLLDG